jgi:endonuclease YncB( thermonuclease family)
VSSESPERRAGVCATLNRVTPRTLVLALGVLAGAVPVAASDMTGTVVGVHDGDTITVRADWRTVRIRLACIDAPELGQSFGARAKQRLSDLAMRRTVRVEVVDKDSYGRLVGRVSVDGDDLNLAMVQSGLAWHYRYHCPNDTALADAERKARVERRGLWADPHPVQPHRWRRGR